MTVREFKKENNYRSKNPGYGMSLQRCTTCAWSRIRLTFKKRENTDPWAIPRDFCTCDGIHFMTDCCHWCNRYVWKWQTSNRFMWQDGLK